MVDHKELPEAALQWDDMTEKEREVSNNLLNLPELVENLRVYGEDQLLPWGWKKRRSAVSSPLTPVPSPSSSLPRGLKISKPRVAHTKEQLMQQINDLTRQKTVYQRPQQLLKEINKLTRRRKVYQEELLEVQSHLEKQIEFNNTLKELTGSTRSLAYRD